MGLSIGIKISSVREILQIWKGQMIKVKQSLEFDWSQWWVLTDGRTVDD